MSGIVESLERANTRSSRTRAALRRSLAFAPGTYAPSYPFVEPFLGDDTGSWRREMTYLVAGLWASHWREGQTRERTSLARAAAAHWTSTGSPSTERRFINLLDADSDQLPNRLRQMVALLKDQPIDFDLLLQGLVYWNGDQKRTQNQWAREFYRAAGNEGLGDHTSTDGASQ